MKNIPPKQVEDALIEVIKYRYPAMQEIWRNIDFEKAGEGYVATVIFYFPQKEAIALFEWKRMSPSSREYGWYCTRDWSD